MKHQMVIELSSEQAEELGAPGDPTSTTTTNSEESPEHSKFDETKPDDNFENAQVGERPTFSIPLQNKSKKQPPPNIPAATPNKPGCTDRIRLGICALDKKARSKPMAEILSRLDEDIFCVVFFGDAMILEEPVENWPVCDVLIAFFSKGYPLNKAKEYVKLRKPFILNDLDMQEVLQDRRRVYDLLEASGIETPRHVYCSVDGYISSGSGNGNGTNVLKEFDDNIEVNGVTIHKPFVEKPANAEDHNIAIYYPTSAGGGCKKLFRKVGNRSSEFYPDINEVRRDGSYIYEEFVETQGTDVKLYTVGPEYGHAEARKSPTVDGKVERNSDGKEIRFPVILTYREKEITRRIVLVFKQFVCGFDILRVQQGHSVVSFVCDVNGWSFVKNSRKYYDDCAQILSEHILAAIKPEKLKSFSTLDPMITTSLNRLEFIAEEKKGGTFLSRATRMLHGDPVDDDDDDDDDHSDAAESHETGASEMVDGTIPERCIPDDMVSAPASMCQSTNSSVAFDERCENLSRSERSQSLDQESHEEELRCVLAIIRHGDRTPKQKLKLNMSEPHILQYFHNHSKDCKKDLKVKAKGPLTEFLQTVKTTLRELERTPATENLRYELLHMRDVLERWKIAGLNRKLQIKPRKFEVYVDENGENKERCAEVQLILKWGGNLTRLGEKQSISLGRRFRHEMYPDASGGGILRLHSTFRHDLKIKTSDEGRVMKTAAAFAKGLLELEGDLPPILVSLVHKEKDSMHMLDPSGNKEVKMELDECKEKITSHLQLDIDVGRASEEELEQLVGPKEIDSIRSALSSLGNPRKALKRIHDLIKELIYRLEEMLSNLGSGDEAESKAESSEEFALSGVKLYKGETLLELTERWKFIFNRLYDEDEDTFDLSRIPDVHDNVRFDMLHNPHLGLTDILGQLYELAKNFADCVVPQEYGTTISEKRSVGLKICRGLLEKIKFDLGVARTDNKVDMRYMINMDYSADLPINAMGRRIRTRLYFTSESHLHTILNVLRFGDMGDSHKSLLSQEGVGIISKTPELCYLTHVVMRVFEDIRPEMKHDPRRFRVEILFSPGATATPLHLGETDRDLDFSRLDTAPLQMIGREGLNCLEVEDFFEKAIMEARSDDDPRNEMAEAFSLSTLTEGLSKISRFHPDSSNLSVHTSPAPAFKESSIADAVSESPCAVRIDPNAAAEIVADEKREDEPRSVGITGHVTFRSVEDVVSPMNHDDEGEMGTKIMELPGNISSTNGQTPEDENDNCDEESVSTINTLTSEIIRKVVARKHFWSTIAVGSFVIGAGCLLLALKLTDDSRQRKWSRYYAR